MRNETISPLTGRQTNHDRPLCEMRSRSCRLVPERRSSDGRATNSQSPCDVIWIRALIGPPQDGSEVLTVICRWGSTFEGWLFFSLFPLFLNCNDSLRCSDIDPASRYILIDILHQESRRLPFLVLVA
jgi:hypothetical protein